MLLAATNGVLMLWIFGKVSHQKAIRQVRERIRGNLFGIRIYRHDLRVVLGLQNRILRDTLVYLKYAFVPMLVLLIPVMLILAQVNRRFSLRPLPPGQATLVKVQLRAGVLPDQNVTLQTSEEIVVETPALHILPEQEVAWRIRAKEPGRYLLRVRVADTEVDKVVWVGTGWGAVPALRTSHVGHALLYSGEPPIQAGIGIVAIEVLYPSLALSLLGWQVHWLTLFLVLSLLVGLACKRLLRVEI
jgi:hypothetical protein